MKYIFFVFVLPLFANAHPGIGIVQDSKGNIFYTDLHHVWKINTAGAKSIAVNGVHTHELSIDANDNLFGEHLWYNGERADTWGHYVWRLGPHGELDTVIKPTEGFLKDYSFVRDSLENMYWVERAGISAFKKKTKDGIISTIAKGKFKDVRWMHATPSGTIYFVDFQDLYKIDASAKFILVAKDVTQTSLAFRPMQGRHSMFGIWADKSNNVYIANYSGQVVKRIAESGKTTNFVYSITPWSPTGGLFDKEGNLWLLECSITNEQRVRKISPSEFEQAKPDSIILGNYLVPIFICLAVVVGIFFAIKWMVQKKAPASL